MVVTGLELKVQGLGFGAHGARVRLLRILPSKVLRESYNTLGSRGPASLLDFFSWIRASLAKAGRRGILCELVQNPQSKFGAAFKGIVTLRNHDLSLVRPQ